MKKNNSNKVKLGASDKIVRGFGYVVITIYALACIFPFLLILGSSFTAEEVIRTEGVQLIPKQFTLAAYEMVCKGGGIWKSYLLTIHPDGGRYGGRTDNHSNDRLCTAEKRFPVPQRNFLLHIFYKPVFRRTCTVLSSDDTDLPLKGQLFCSFITAYDVAVADHHDEKLCEGDPA